MQVLGTRVEYHPVALHILIDGTFTVRVKLGNLKSGLPENRKLLQ
jgi:hypothetical protein